MSQNVLMLLSWLVDFQMVRFYDTTHCVQATVDSVVIPNSGIVALEHRCHYQIVL